MFFASLFLFYLFLEIYAFCFFFVVVHLRVFTTIIIEWYSKSNESHRQRYINIIKCSMFSVQDMYMMWAYACVGRHLWNAFCMHPKRSQSFYTPHTVHTHTHHHLMIIIIIWQRIAQCSHLYAKISLMYRGKKTGVALFPSAWLKMVFFRFQMAGLGPNELRPKTFRLMNYFQLFHAHHCMTISNGMMVIL